MAKLEFIFIFLNIVLTRTKVFCFNLEDRDPIVKRPHDAKNTYFGFSVAEHAVSDKARNPQDYWLLVGAPLGKNLQPGTNRSGALFKCPVTTNQDDCVQVETDGKRFNDFEYDDEPGDTSLVRPGRDEIKEDQWLGVTVKSQKPGGKVVVCAHRYIQSPNLTLYHYGMGLCYLLNHTLEAMETLEPCKTLPKEKLHQQFGFCQVGTSLDVLDDGFTLMGSPGPYTWRGTIFAKSVQGSFLERDKTVYKGPLNESPTPIDKYSYLGMSVTGGRFFKKNETNFVSGAPRSNFTGQVFIFDRTVSNENLQIHLIINGTQFASSFGYEILAVDIDNDGYDELLVAAPFYYSINVGGAVYIYNEMRKCRVTDCKESTIFYGKPESRFGFAMTSLGDINKDGFNDVAIGAPYEGDSGAIYIYLGQKDSLNPEPSQIIKHRGFKTLGYSMSGGLDMDLNDYPDLLVGAYESDSVFLYKTRPIIDIHITVEGEELKNINVSRKGCSVDSQTNKTCFTFKTCFSLSKYQLRRPLEIRYEIKELPKRIPRVALKVEKTIVTVNSISQQRCVDEVAYIVEGNGDILTPIKFLVNYSIYRNEVHSPILNKTSVKTFEATFQKNCGDDDICFSNLVLNTGTSLNRTDEGHYMLDLGKNKEFILDANITNNGESAYEAKFFVEHPEGLSYVALQTDKNETISTICTSNNESTLVTCTLGNPFPENHSVKLGLRFEISDTKKLQMDLRTYVNSTSKELSTQTSRNLTVILQKIASYVIKGEGKPQNIFYVGEVKGESAMQHLEDIGPRVVHSYDIINQGNWKIRDMKVIIEWPYQIYSDRSQGGKWLLYLEKIPTIELNNKCTVDPPNVVNSLGLNSSGIVEEGMEDLPKSRRKRDVADVVKPEIVKGTDGKERKVATMSCPKMTAKCAVITCRISQLNENSQIKINISARVWNSTLIEDYKEVDWVSLNSVAEVIIEDETVTQSNNSVNVTSIETKAYPPALADKGVNLWIIVGSVIAGLFVLIVVILILYKCGFFKRNRVKDRTLSANLNKQGESEELLKESEQKSSKRT